MNQAVETSPTAEPARRICEVTFDTQDATRHRRVCSKPPGSWGLPFDPEAHGARLRDCLGARLTDAQIRSVLGLLDNLERLSAREIGEPAALLA